MLKPTIGQDEIPRVRRWRGRELSPVEEVLMFHDNAGPVPDTYRRLVENLSQAGIEFVVIGALAMAAHQFRRATEDIDICVTEADLDLFRKSFVGSAYQNVEGLPRRFVDTETGVTVDVLVSGRLAGRTNRNKVIRFPDPSEAVEIDDISTVPLNRLIELKLVTWRFKDWADVISLIRNNGLDEGFAEQLDPLVRMAYLECYDQMREEDKYDREHEGV